MPHPDRQKLIDLLGRLDGPDEKDVVAAARAVALEIKESGTSWDELLVPSGSGRAEALDPDPPGEGEVPLAAEERAEARAEIEAVLALKAISATTREDLEGLRADLDRGALAQSDLRYVRALRARLEG